MPSTVQISSDSPVAALGWPSVSRGRWLTLLSALLYFFGFAATAAEVNSIHEFKKLSPSELQELKTIELRGVVLCCDSGWNQLYVWNGDETAYFNPHDFKTVPKRGDQVTITGRTARQNLVTGGELKITGTQPLPPAIKMDLNQLANNWCEWIQTTGWVISVENSSGRYALLIQAAGQNCLIYVLGDGQPGTDLQKLAGSRISARGINASKIVDGHLENATIFVPGADEITVLERSGGVNPMDIPVSSIGSLFNPGSAIGTKSLVHVNGTIASYQPGHRLVVKDPTGVIRARVIQLNEIQVDERVDVWGFLENSSNEIFLDSAYFASTSSPSQSLGRNPSLFTEEQSNVPPVLTEVSQILKLRREESARQIPVKLQGVITYADADWRNGFFQDSTGAIYVDLSDKSITAGQVVQLEGRTSPGGFAPEILDSNLKVIGTTNLPAPAKVDLEDLANGRLDAHWVQMDGVVRRVDEQWGHLTLNLMTPKGRFKAVIPVSGNEPAPNYLIDALISVQGACSSELNVRRQLSGITLHAPSLDQVKILEPPPKDTFSIPALLITDVATFDPDRLAGRRVKVSGVVTLKLPGQGFILEDGSGGIRVLTRQTNDIQIGDAVAVLAFPAIGDFSPYLEEASFRRLGAISPPVLQSTSAEKILAQGTMDNRLVEVKARLLQSVPESANPQLVLQDGPIIFVAHLETQDPRLKVPALQSGSLLKLSGVCSIQGGEKHEPVTFRILLRRPGDIELLEAAPWWNRQRTLTVLGGMVVAIFGALVWAGSLSRQVVRQTDLIREKLEAEAALEERYVNLFENANDMVYTHDLKGCVTSINKTGERLLQRSRTEILSRPLLDFMIPEERGAAQAWLDQVLQGTAPSTAEWDFLAASGQTIKLEISTRLIEQDGEFVEVEGIARDITERKRLEREILDISNREQRRIGHDLHDGVCQQLAGIAFMSHSLATRLQQRGVPESEQAEGISSLINTAINHTRGVARGLFPVRLEENGLASALEELAANTSELFKINCRFNTEDPAMVVDHEIALHLYYIALEAVANACKHGHARNILVKLVGLNHRGVLEIRDDGKGFVQQSGPQVGMGIRIMHYRARVIGATLNLQSAPGSGTHITCLFQPHSPAMSGGNPGQPDPVNDFANRNELS